MPGDMSDDISIPPAATNRPGSVTSSHAHSYRARRTGMDAGTRRLVMVASALGLVLLAGMGMWTFSGHRAVGVPVIEADTRPIRVKPENPGGMVVAGANDQVMGGRGDGADAAGDLAPEAERPDPQALRAQRQIAASPARPGAATVAATAAPTDVPPTVSTATPSPAAPASPPRPAPATGGTMVQLAAVDSEAAAATEWQRLSRKAPELLADRKLAVTRTEKDGTVFWRVRTGGFADIAAAAEFCRKARAKGLGCSIGT